MSSAFGESGGRLDYSGYLHLRELLKLQEGRSDAPDELLFIVVHQVYELWFKVLLGSLEAARAAIGSDLLRRAVHELARVRVIERLLVDQVDVLETMAPHDFLAFRSQLAPASGFQSVQFREIEFISGLKDESYLARLDADPEERERLARRLAEPSLAEAFAALLSRRRVPSVAAIYAGSEPERERLADLRELGEALLDHDESFALWRARHLLMVERQIGSKPGTGGSSGAEYLRTTQAKRFFPDLWQARSGFTL
ncbi:MAG TPA: tryptophan 2,3-dioxygenase family protein [Candidatus Saccharimonadales bacterium]|nr:tryptophan 2,3-dioxygenase family protein [Candidatus Saccharimonadales bacterium]